jgi:hypothetical protein
MLTLVHSTTVEGMTATMPGLSLAPTYLYLDDEGSTRWQGEASVLPMLDLLVERPKFRPHPQVGRKSMN